VFTDAKSRAGAGCVAAPQGATRALGDLVAGHRGRMDGYAISTARNSVPTTVLLCAWTTHAVSELTVAGPAGPEPVGAPSTPGLGYLVGLGGGRRTAGGRN